MRLTREQAKKLGVDVPVKRSKYGNKRTEYNGRMYDSKAEAEYAMLLDSLGLWWLPQVPVQLGDVRYVADFLVHNPPGRPWFVDVKGHETPRFRQVRKLWTKYGPGMLHVAKLSGRMWTTDKIEGKQ